MKNDEKRYEVRSKSGRRGWGPWSPWCGAEGSCTPLAQVIDWGYTVTLKSGTLKIQYRRAK